MDIFDSIMTWFHQVVAIIGAAMMTAIGWIFKSLMGHNKRISKLETSIAVLESRLENIDKNLSRGIKTIENLEGRHRDDIIRAYQQIEKLHVALIAHISRFRENQND